MGLFINKNSFPKIFKSKNKIAEPNQEILHRDYLNEFIQEQLKMNQTLANSYDDMKNTYQQQELVHLEHWQDVGEKLNQIHNKNVKHEQFEDKATEKLEDLDVNNRRLHEVIGKEAELNKEILEQINSLSQFNQEVVSKLEENEDIKQEIDNKLQELYRLQVQMVDDFSQEKDKQNQVIDKLENQEANTEKIIRQLDHIRASLFERASHLAEKIEDGYTITSSFIYQLISGSDLPYTMLSNKQKSKERQSDKR